MTPPATAMSGASIDRLARSLRASTVDQVQRALSAEGEGRGDLDPVMCPDGLRVGMDLVPVADVAASVDRLGRRYLYRVFTPHERACARIGPRGDAVLSTESSDVLPVDLGGRAGDGMSALYSMQSLAGRFAAKEAAVKVLRPRGARPEWRSIEVRRAVGGWCELRLSGLAARLADEAGLTALAVSVTHEPMMAAACVVAMSKGGAAVWHQTPSPERKGM